MADERMTASRAIEGFNSGSSIGRNGHEDARLRALAVGSVKGPSRGRGATGETRRKWTLLLSAGND
jgi:hypothetical protein